MTEEITTHKSIIIVGSGASAKGFVPPLDIPTIVVNGVIDWIPHCNYWFTLDPSPENILRMRNPRAGIRYFAAVPHVLKLPMHVTKFARMVGSGHGRLRTRAGISKDPRHIHTGNSAWGALGMAYHMGARNVMIIGVDGDNSERCEGGYSRDLSHLSDLFHSALDDINIISCGNLAGFKKYDLEEAYEWLRKGME